MSFASILSEPAVERTPRKSTPPPVKQQPPPPPPPPPPQPSQPAPAPTPIAPLPKPEKTKPAPEKRRSAQAKADTKGNSRQSNANGTSDSKASARTRRTLSDRENERINRAMEKIDAMDKSDVEAPGFEDEWERYIMKGKKRTLNTEKLEAQKRKV